MDTRVGCGAISILADICNDAIKSSFKTGNYVEGVELIEKYQGLLKYLREQDG